MYIMDTILYILIHTLTLNIEDNLELLTLTLTMRNYNII